jgi:hypothetical protein
LDQSAVLLHLLWADLTRKRVFEGREVLAFQGRVEEKAPCPDYQITKQRNGKDLVMSIATTAEDALDSKPHEHQVR